MSEQKDLSFVIAVNDDKVFKNNVLASPIFMKQEIYEIIVKRGYPSASLAYNDGLKDATKDIVVFLHQDVYLPSKWDTKLIKKIEDIESTNPSWGVLGCYGVNKNGKKIGHVYSNGLVKELGKEQKSKQVISLDELLLVIKKSSGLKYDPKLQHFHLYGTDICLQAETTGLKNYAISNLCIHNSLPVMKLPKEYWRCVEFIRRKWKNYLPVKTCVLEIKKSYFRILIERLHDNISYLNEIYKKREYRRLTMDELKYLEIKFSVRNNSS